MSAMEHGIIGTFNVMPIDELKKQLSNWVDKMNTLNKESIAVLGPKRAFRDKSVSSNLENNVGSRLPDNIRQEISKFQGIDEDGMKKAIDIMKE